MIGFRFGSKAAHAGTSPACEVYVRRSFDSRHGSDRWRWAPKATWDTIRWPNPPTLIRSRIDAHAVLLSRAVRRRGQQRLWPEGVRIPAIVQHAFQARARLRCVVRAAPA